ncbi:phosphoenolpyruvate carboxylase, partial [candidate division KSB1 bacterium]|nr:phosphoenolpyruvate carboxylase [candidate division KSB1 bacterium]
MRRWHGIEINSQANGIPKSLSKQVDFLGRLLGHVIREQAGDEIFARVELLRTLCKTANLENDLSKYDEVQQIIHELKLDEIVWIIRAFTIFFHLVNEAERQEIIRVNRERDFDANPEKPHNRTIMEAIYQLKQKGVSYDEMLEILQRLDIQPTLTAHPTEARRRTILHKQKQIARLLSQLLLNDEITTREEDALFGEIYCQIALLMTTDDVRARRLTVQDEIRNGLYFSTSSIWETVPRIYQDLQDAISLYFDQRPELPVFFRYRSWIGGDRDGNPFVTPEITEMALRKYRKGALRMYAKDLVRLRREISISARRITISAELQASIAHDLHQSKHAPEYKHRYTHEPYRIKISLMLEKINYLMNNP